MFHTTPEYQETVNNNYDCYGDSYCRDIEADELAAVSLPPFLSQMNFNELTYATDD